MTKHGTTVVTVTTPDNVRYHVRVNGGSSTEREVEFQDGRRLHVASCAVVDAFKWLFEMIPEYTLGGVVAVTAPKGGAASVDRVVWRSMEEALELAEQGSEYLVETYNGTTAVARFDLHHFEHDGVTINHDDVVGWTDVPRRVVT